MAHKLKSAPSARHSSASRSEVMSSSRSSTMSAESTTDFESMDVNEPDSSFHDSSSVPQSVTTSRLFSLPREIRDRIYALCMTAKNGSAVEWPALPGSHATYGLQPQILRTCKIIYDEVGPLLYTENGFTFHHPSDANMFVRAIASPINSRFMINLNLHIKAGDTRLWMNYLNSTDTKRSLKHDFPQVRELVVRFRSNKWSHSMSANANMKAWSEDSRLDEIIRSLRDLFLPWCAYDGRAPQMSAQDFQAYLYRHHHEPFHNTDATLRQQAMDHYKAQMQASMPNTEPPIVKVICACRVSTNHFNTLTGLAPLDPTAQPGLAAGLPLEPEIVATPVRDREPFRGFTAVDLRTRRIRRLHDAELGSANVAQTPYADKHGVLLALEVHCLDPKQVPIPTQA